VTTTPRHAHPSTPDDPSPATLGRRTLLRRAGAVVAVAGGAAAVTAVASGTAQAATGDPVLAGTANSATSATGLTSSGGSAPTLVLGNTSGSRAPLALADGGSAVLDGSIALDAGSLLNSGGDLYYVNSTALGSQAMVHTDMTTNQVVPIAPIRMLDTRSSAGRTNVLSDPAWHDSAFRLLGGHWVELDLSSLAAFADAAFVNVAVVAPTNSGFLTLAPAASAGSPTTSTLNYVKNVTVANGALVPLSGSLSVFVYSSATTHVLLDVSALNTAPQLVLADPAVKASAARTAMRRNALSAATALRAGG
jgi:hypothetical protein